MTQLKRLFMLDPNTLFFNHGSFGACPRPVIKVYQDWQKRLERQPIQFFHHDLPGLEKEARGILANYLNVPAETLAFVTNATFGVNIISRSLALQTGDEVLTTNHEYGSCDNAWNFACRKTGATYVQHPIPLPLTTMDDVADELWRGVTPRTKVIYLSHITSPTATRLPVEEICRRARQSGILTFIDGAHAPGQIPLDLAAIGVDFYTSNCHKWMLSPKGTGFLYARQDVQSMVLPLVVSHAYEPEKYPKDGHPMEDYFYWTGTYDPSGILSIPAAIAFMEKYDWQEVRKQCHYLLRYAIERICEMTHLDPLYPLDSEFYSMMGIAPLPSLSNLPGVAMRLYDELHVVMPLIKWQDLLFARISVQGYNTQKEVNALLSIIDTLISEYK